MKTLTLIPFVFLLMSFTHPFAQDGSVDNDRELLDERIEKAQENKTQEERAREKVKQEQEANEELDQELRPEAILEDKKDL